MNRRNFLRGLGATLALPFLPSFDGFSEARAQAGRWPMRLVIFHTANGQPMRLWRPTGGENDFQLSQVLAPLDPIRRKLLILRGLDMPAQRGESGHAAGTNTVLTGTELAGDSAGGISVDQLCAQRVGGDTPLRSLELAVQTYNSVLGHISHLGPGQPVPAELDPRRAHERVYRAFQAPGAPVAVPGLDPRHASVLDAVKADYARLNRRLGGADRVKLEAHVTQVRELERRLQIMIQPPVTCHPSAQPPESDGYAEGGFPQVGRLHMDLMVAALSCDRTRVASLMWQEGSNNQAFTWLDPPVRESHHELSHTIIYEGTPLLEHPEEGKLLAINRWYAQQFLYLCRALDGIPDGDGTLLDHTIVLWTNEISDGYIHNRNDMPFVMAGGGRYFRTGRHLNFAPQPHNQLLVSIANAMGVNDVDRIGEFGDAGPLAGLT